jgi:hypothetical protein
VVQGHASGGRSGWCGWSPGSATSLKRRGATTSHPGSHPGLSLVARTIDRWRVAQLPTTATGRQRPLRDVPAAAAGRTTAPLPASSLVSQRVPPHGHRSPHGDRPPGRSSRYSQRRRYRYRRDGERRCEGRGHHLVASEHGRSPPAAPSQRGHGPLVRLHMQVDVAVRPVLVIRAATAAGGEIAVGSRWHVSGEAPAVRSPAKRPAIRAR